VTPWDERPRPALARGIIILPSAFTLGNLFFGLMAIVEVIRGDYLDAGWFIVFAGVLDVLDGRVARFTRTGSAFGAELDSLVDAISFGVAPAVLMIHLFFLEGDWSWTVAFVYATAVVVRLARFNIEQAGRAKRHFVGLPSPAAGMILATYVPFSTTALFAEHLTSYPWPRIAAVSMVLLSVLMVSQIPYAPVPRIGFRTWKGRLNSAVVGSCLLAAILIPRYFFFSFLVVYTIWGLVRSVGLGLLDRLPDRDPLLDEDEDEDDPAWPNEEVRPLDYTELQRPRRRHDDAARGAPPEDDR